MLNQKVTFNYPNTQNRRQKYTTHKLHWSQQVWSSDDTVAYKDDQLKDATDRACSMHGETRKLHKILAVKSEGTRPLRSQWHTLEIIIK
jgi:hypothetical protein